MSTLIREHPKLYSILIGLLAAATLLGALLKWKAFYELPASSWQDNQPLYVLQHAASFLNAGALVDNRVVIWLIIAFVFWCFAAVSVYLAPQRVVSSRLLAHTFSTFFSYWVCSIVLIELVAGRSFSNPNPQYMWSPYTPECVLMSGLLLPLVVPVAVTLGHLIIRNSGGSSYIQNVIRR